jgi:lipopolysaccharide export LptBFGC system permease protein LptF
MNRPGDRLHRLATILCTEPTRRRLIDPAIADLQSEFAVARRVGSARHRLRALATGYVSVVKVLVIAICGDLRVAATTWTSGEAASARRGAVIALAVTTAATAVLTIPVIEQMPEADLGLVVYVVPSALPLSLPLGLAIASAWMLHAAVRTRKVAAAMLLAALLTSTALLVNFEWVIPDANQAFRALVVAKYDPPVASPARGANELRAWELRERVHQARNSGHESQARWLELTYYRRWSMVATPVAMVALMVALAFRRRWTRRALTSVAFGIYLAHYALFMYAFTLAQLGVARPIVIGWAGTFLCLAAALLTTSWPARAAA